MNWAHKLAQKDVAWFVSTTVHIVTMLNRSTGKAKTLKFLNFCDHQLATQEVDDDDYR